MRFRARAPQWLRSRRWLADASAPGAVSTLENDPDFAGLRGSSRFAAIAERLARNRRPIVRGATELALPDTGLLPESIALDSAGAFFVGSLHRRALYRVARDPAGTPQLQKLAGPEDGLLRVVGIKLDRRRNRLWFATWAPGIDTATAAARRATQTRLFSMRPDGRELRQYQLPDTSNGHLLNDLVITRAGDVYVTDTEEGTVWTLPAGRTRLHRVLAPAPGHHDGANGITLSPDDRRLYVAFTQGIAAFDLRSRRLQFLELPPDVFTAGTDGLYWYDNSLIAVQGLGTDERVARFHLDRSGLRVTRSEVLERGAPLFRRPTTGVVRGDTLFYLPNAQYHRLTTAGTLLSDSLARPSEIRRLLLKRE